MRSAAAAGAASRPPNAGSEQYTSPCCGHLCKRGDSARHLQPGQAAPFRVASVLGQLADADFLCLDHAGQITVAYPFSALPTPHRVQIAGHATVFAMCAIDALGISAMTGRPVVIESADPSTGEPITVNVDGASSTWDPATAVVYVGRTGGDCAGPSASVCCGYMNFFAARAAAAAWAASRPEITGGILGQDRALHVGIGIFGRLLS